MKYTDQISNQKFPIRGGGSYGYPMFCYHGNLPPYLKRKLIENPTNTCDEKTEEYGETFNDDGQFDEELEIQWTIKRVWKPVTDFLEPKHCFNNKDAIKTQNHLQMLFEKSATKSTDTIKALEDGIKKLEDFNKKEKKLHSLENGRNRKEIFKLTGTLKMIQNDFKTIQNDKSDEITILSEELRDYAIRQHNKMLDIQMEIKKMEDRKEPNIKSEQVEWKDMNKEQRKRLFIPLPKCPACQNDMGPGVVIKQCKEGHLICWMCSKKLPLCLICKEPYNVRADGLEKYIQRLFK